MTAIRSILLAFLLLWQSGDAASKASIVIFPLVNESGDRRYDWVGPGFSETFSRILLSLETFRVWDPLVLFQTDSIGFDMKSDSLLSRHQNRWQWDAAIGGSYLTAGDSLKLRIKLVRSVNGTVSSAKEYEVSGLRGDFFFVTRDGATKILTAMQYPRPNASFTLPELRPVNSEAYSTFAAGYGMEMHGKRSDALTAYARAEEIDPEFAGAACRQGIMFWRANRFEEACDAFSRALSVSHNEPSIVAHYADFIVECAPAKKAMKFIGAHRTILEMTATGMKAIGKGYYTIGENQRAVASLTKAIAFGPSDLDVEFSLGSVFIATGQYSSAADIFNNLIRYRPGYLRYYASLGGTYRKQGRFMESSLVLESAEKLEPDNPTILIDLAHTYFLLGWYEKAEQLLCRARDVAPQIPAIHVNLGVIRWYLGKKDEAVRCFDRAAATPSMRQSALNNMGNLLFLDGRNDKAIQAYRMANKAGPKNEAILFNLATAYQAEGRYKKAARYFDQALQLSPDRVDVLMNRAMIALRMKRFGDAENAYNRVIELSPEHEAAVRGLAAILIAEKRYREAIQPVEDFLARQPLNREFMTLLPSIYKTIGWFEVALMKYQRALNEFPGDSAASLGVGECMYAMIRNKGMQNYEDAIAALQKAVKSAPGNPLPEMLVGDIYAEFMGRRESAVDMWQKALGKAGDNRNLRKMLENKIAGKH
ncbi:MAG: tetratricopeptide repeat protein [Chitinispirillaceae bacterium]|jgi:tetratricopeptide (TPR) repeat protein|nr:tetratricopeptide repeat protein [Chitinispirillaceae bacterium]